MSIATDSDRGSADRRITPRETLARCSVRAELRADPMVGTAFPSPRLLLVEQPGPWGRQGLTQSHFDSLVARAVIRRLDEAGVRVLAIRRPGRAPEPAARSWFWVDTRGGRAVLRAGTFDHDADLTRIAEAQLSLDAEATRDASGAPPAESASDGAAPAATTTAGPSMDGPLYLVCAHGSHDACCALRGRPVAAALQRLRPDQVWECSHVGGDRFAANVLVLPSGMLYGSVHLVEAPALVEATERGQVLAGPLRGRIGMPPEAQAALSRAYQHWGGAAAAVSVGALHRADDGTVTVALTRTRDGVVDHGEVDVVTDRAPVHRLTCQMTVPATVSVFRPGEFRETGRPGNPDPGARLSPNPNPNPNPDPDPDSGKRLRP